MNYLSKTALLVKCARGSHITKCDAAQTILLRRSSSSATGSGDGFVQSSVKAAINLDSTITPEELHKPDGWITLAEFKYRRKCLAKEIFQFSNQFLSKSKASHATIRRNLLVIPASERQYMVGKIPYFYRQSTDFRYLTGHLAPDAALLIDVERTEKSPTSTVDISSLHSEIL